MGDFIDFTLSNARRFYSSKGKNLAAKGLSSEVNSKGYCSLRAGSHLGAHARAAKSEFKTWAILQEGVWWRRAKKVSLPYPALCKFFISASPERSEIPLVKKKEKWQNCQSIMFQGKRLDPQGVGNLLRLQKYACIRNVSATRPVCLQVKIPVKEGAENRI